MLVVLDAVAGASLLAVGAVAWRRSHASSLWAIGAAAAWFAASVAPALVLLHRPLLLHAILALTPGGMRGALPRALLATAWVGAVLPAAAQGWVSLTTSALCIAVAVRDNADRQGFRSYGAARRAALLLLSAGLALPVLQRLAWPRYDDVGLPIATYLCAITLGSAVIVWGIVTSGQRETDAVIELSDRTPAGTLEHLKGLAEAEAHDGRGRALASAIALLEENARLQRDLAERIAEVRDSRARLVDAAVEERQRLERLLASGAIRYLEELEECLRPVAGRADGEATVASCLQQITHTREDLEQLARGLHPRILTERGLAAALEEITLRSPVPVDVSVPTDRFPERIETTLWYACAEALANVWKHAHASKVGVHVVESSGALRATITDDGIGRATLSPDGGLTGLADRVSAVDGSLSVASSGAGTEVTITVPLP
jgi:glucose-6-phosphate-specific signal transduction histidine kinase